MGTHNGDHARGPIPERATIEDVARDAGVSVATVSRALRDLPHVAASTKAKVRSSADRLQYVADTNAARLASGRTRTIGLIAPIMTSWYTGEMVAGVEDVLQAHGYDLLITTSGLRHRGEAADQMSFQQRVDGAVLVDVFCGDAAAARIAAAGTAAVVVGEQLTALPSIAVDNRLGAELAVRHLAQLGHRRIALIGGRSEGDTVSTVPDQREDGYWKALRDARLRRDRRLEHDGAFTIDGARNAARRLFSLSERPTAVFCMSDEMAYGVMHAARDAGISIPRDLSVVGFDDHPVSEAFGLTTVRQPVRDMGRLAASSLLDVLDHDAPAPPHRDMPVGLIQRSSTAAPNAS
jgi:LacI family transcriptional regulator, repressor for deo operon, udp, cdd, tsx, nupC, and nupG